MILLAEFVPRRISVVVAAFNGAREIEEMLDNVLGQVGVDIEVVVIDGGSTDGTVGILSARSDALGFWCSEPDDGIYNAWNKALERVTGEWVLFLGVDDRFADTTSAASLLQGADSAPAGTNLVVGRGRLRHADGTTSSPYGHYTKRAIKRYSCMMTPATMIHRTLLARHAPFAEDLPIAGDYDFYLRAVDDTVAHNISTVTCLFGDAGVSSHVLPALRDTRKAQSRSPHVGPIRAYVNYARHVATIPVAAVYAPLKRKLTTSR